MQEVILGIGGYLGHDANAALVVDGNLVAASQEERFTRKKHDGSYPKHAIEDCLSQAGLPASSVTDCVFAEKPFHTALFDIAGTNSTGLTRWLGRHLPPRYAGLYDSPARAHFTRAGFHYAWHHVSHIVGAYHTSDFEKAAFLCVDGKGEDYCASAGVIDRDSCSILWEQPYENGLGLLYTLVTHFLGFHSFGSEYKVMGLAPYGRPNRIDSLSRLFATDANGGLRLHAPVRFRHEVMSTSIRLVEEATGIPARAKHEPLTQEHIDIAASLQRIFEDEIIKMVRFLRSQTEADSLIFCGGCAQNCVTAGKMRAQRLFGRIFNSPVGGDMGSGLGAALLLARKRRAGLTYRIDAKGYYLGSEPGPIPEQAQPWRVSFAGSLHDFIAAQLAAGKTVGWIRGRMELGARALGARSIFADPRQPGIQSRLNLAVKFRESFRPFAPAILLEHVDDWFDSSEESHYMNYTANLLEHLRAPLPAAFASLREQLDFPRCRIPSVVHVDYSARLQTVHRDVHPDFHRLLTAFHGITGVPILINTSFNVSGQPIVRTAAEGWDCFVNTDLDLLVLNDCVYRNPQQKTREEKLAWLDQFAASA